MEKTKIAIIGGGAAGLFLANRLYGEEVTLFERSDRLGKKLSATGNGQGNVTNLAVKQTDYFSCVGEENARIRKMIADADEQALIAFFQNRGVLLTADERGRVYPASRQASALTDALRFGVEKGGAKVRFSSLVTDVKKVDDGFVLTFQNAEGAKQELFAEKVVLCAGGKAAKNLGTDGSAYALAQRFGHTVTALYPSLVQLKTDTSHTKTLKGIRVNDAKITARLSSGKVYSLTGDVIFTDYGISGDAVFRISAFITDKISQGISVEIDFLPTISEEKILSLALEKRKAFPDLPQTELLFGIVNNQVGRAIVKRADGDLQKAAALTKAFPLEVKGSLGFDYAQVTKGGIPLCEVNDDLESRQFSGLYFAGEILDVDGPCGGFNLQWAFSSANRVAKALKGEMR